MPRIYPVFNLLKLITFGLAINLMAVFLHGIPIDSQSAMQKDQPSAIVQTVQPIKKDEAKKMAFAIVEEVTISLFQEPAAVRASYFGGEEGDKDFHGKAMANGEVFDKNDTEPAAHLKLPFGTKVTLVEPTTKNEVEVTIKTRGPYVPDRQFDVSKAAAKKLGMIEEGVAPLLVTKIKLPKGARISLNEAYAML